jgi:hypothetical protein
MNTIYLATDLRSRTTYVFERKRKGGRFVPTAFPADKPGPEIFVSRRKVPLAIRRAVKQWESLR